MDFYGTTSPLEVGKHVCSLLICQGLLGGGNGIFDGVAFLFLDMVKNINICNTKPFLQGSL